MKAPLLALALTVGFAARAQADLPDASLPDASVGEGGPDRMSQEGDDTPANGPCLATKDCERGFTCVSSRCIYTGVRTARGCAGGTGALLLSAGLLGLLWRARPLGR